MKQYAIEFLNQLWLVSLEAAPWLLLGLIVSALIKVWMPAGLMQRWLGGRGFRPVFNAAILGTPLPLCSCSVVPAAVTLRRTGASKSATVSFLVATPENGADSIALSYALLGPFMTIVRPIAAVSCAISAGLMTAFVDDEVDPGALKKADPSAPSKPAATSCCDKTAAVNSAASETNCCSDKMASKDCCSTDQPKPAQASSCCDTASDEPAESTSSKLASAFHFAIDDLLGDIVFWLGIGLVLAAVINTLVPPGAMAQWGSGLLPMLGMLLVGVPMYICATASTPLAAAMLIAGVSPGTTLVFLLAGPATNLGTIGIVRRELGNRACATYLAGVCGGALIAGLLVDWIAGAMQLSVAAQVSEHGAMIPHWLAVVCLVALAIATLRLLIRKWLRPKAAACCDATSSDLKPTGSQPAATFDG